MLTFLIAVAAVCGIHRIWNYEDVFAGVRRSLERLRTRLGWLGGVLTPVLCPVCNPVWIGVGVGALSWWAGEMQPWAAAALPFAAYPVVRGLVWVYDAPIEALLRPHQCAAARPPAAAARPPAAPHPPAGAKPAAAVAPAEKKKCSGCAAKAEAVKAERAHSDQFHQRVVLMTALADFDPSYSLVSVIFDQARALAADPKRLVQVWVMEGAKLDKVPAGLPANVMVRAVIPATHWREDVVDDAAASKLQRDLLMKLFTLGNATIITHDLLLVSWYTTFAAAIHRMGTVKAFSWIHQVHSCVGAKPPETAATRLRTTLPAGHLLAVVNATEVEPAAAYYGIEPSRVVVIPNTRDLGTWGATPAAQEVLAKTVLREADIAQVFPLSLPRADAKGLEHVIWAHGALRRRGRTTALVVVDAHANAANADAQKQRYRETARDAGVSIAFTSDLLPDTAAAGVDAATVRALYDAANVFILPSISESSGLVALEAAACSNHVWVNANVPALAALVASSSANGWPFPSQTRPDAGPVDYDALADDILREVDADAHGSRRRAFARGRTVTSLVTAVEAAVAAAKPIP